MDAIAAAAYRNGVSPKDIAGAVRIEFDTADWKFEGCSDSKCTRHFVVAMDATRQVTLYRGEWSPSKNGQRYMTSSQNMSDVAALLRRFNPQTPQGGDVVSLCLDTLRQEETIGWCSCRCARVLAQ
jgi:hypothetical protein